MLVTSERNSSLGMQNLNARHCTERTPFWRFVTSEKVQEDIKGKCFTSNEDSFRVLTNADIQSID